MYDQPPSKELIGVIVGAVLLFVVISLIPIVVMWYQRRNTASRRASEIRQLSVDGFVRHVSVEQWLGGQPRNVEQYAQDICAICLSTLALRLDPLSGPEPALIRASSPARCSSPARVESGLGFTQEEQIMVLSGCNHAFHSSCLESWFEYERDKCPMCQAPYFPAD